jgi:hypothetical protein
VFRTVFAIAGFLTNAAMQCEFIARSYAGIFFLQQPRQINSFQQRIQNYLQQVCLANILFKLA